LSVYHWLVILILFFAFIMHGGRKGNTAFIVVAAILMFCLLGLRDCKTIGNDSRTSYLSQFYSDGQKDWEDLRDIRDWGRIGSDDSDSGHDRNFGLQWLMKIVYVVSGGQYQWFIVIAAVIVLVSESVYIQKYSPSPLQSVLYFLGLLLYMFHFSATKQSMAMCILLFSFPAIIEKKPIRFGIGSCCIVFPLSCPGISSGVLDREFADEKRLSHCAGDHVYSSVFLPGFAC